MPSGRRTLACGALSEAKAPSHSRAATCWRRPIAQRRVGGDSSFTTGSLPVRSQALAVIGQGGLAGRRVVAGHAFPAGAVGEGPNSDGPHYAAELGVRGEEEAT